MFDDFDEETLAIRLAKEAGSNCFDTADAYEEREKFRLRANDILENGGL